MKKCIVLFFILVSLSLCNGYDAHTELVKMKDSLQPFIQECKNVNAYKTTQGIAIQQLCTTETSDSITTAKKTIFIQFTTTTFYRTIGR